MTITVKSLTAILCLMGACSPKVSIQVLQPADVYIDPDITTVAFVDRSMADSIGETLLGAAEGLLTGEEIGADNAGRVEAEHGFRHVFGQSPRFKLITPMTGDISSSLFESDINWDQADKICKKSGCQGIVALESFDSNSSTSVDREMVEKTIDGKTVHRPEFSAQRETEILTSWRFYDVKNKAVIDSLHGYGNANTWDYDADTEDGALDSLPSQAETIRELAYFAGEDYARRVAPNYIIVQRTVYTRGDDHLKAAKPYVKTSNWNEARKLWKKTVESSISSEKARGRALYNLAVGHEVDGNLEKALELAEQANTTYPSGTVGDYAQVIRQRLYDAKKVEKQMSK